MSANSEARNPAKAKRRRLLRLGVDTGGTFTDLVLFDGSEVSTAKVPSTPDDPSRAIVQGIERLGGLPRGTEIVHGTTVALNALLTGRTARTALVTNRGFRDLIEIGRQERPDIYALHPVKAVPLVPRELRFEVGQRSWPAPKEDGNSSTDNGLVQVERPSTDELDALARRVSDCGAESVAVCLLHGYADPGIEEEVATAFEHSGLPVTCSAVLLRAYREFERFSTAIVNAALVPVLSAYLERLQNRLTRVGDGRAALSVLQSSGGSLAAERAAREPVRVLLSGPAGGVVGAARAAAEAGLQEVVTLDMGGTSTDVAFHAPTSGLESVVQDSRVAGHPIAVKTLDIHTIGCGGGSIAHLDAGGVLHVGPMSAGADPGPMCYGQGEQPTVTDAHVFLGHVAQGEGGGFLQGELELDLVAVKQGFAQLAKKLGVTPRAAARGVLEVARSAMRRAVGVMTMQRGRDPRDLPLVAFGGAGGLSAAPLAQSLGMRGALVPAHPGLLSAWGMARAQATCDRERTVLAPLDAWSAARRKRALAELLREAKRELAGTGVALRSIVTESALGLRYRGQSYEITVPESGNPAREFEERHEELYGWRLGDQPIELVQLAVRASSPELSRRARSPKARRLQRAAVLGRRKADFGRVLDVPRLDRTRLQPGVRFRGPAILEEFSGTTLVPPAWKVRVTNGGHLWMEAPTKGSKQRP